MKTVLIVDDVPDILDNLREILDVVGGWSIITAEDAASAIALAHLSQPDLIVTDIYMPTMDGNAMIAALKANPQTRHIPVMVMTGDARRSTMRRSLALGACEYLIKPFEITRFVNAVQSYE